MPDEMVVQIGKGLQAKRRVKIDIEKTCAYHRNAEKYPGKNSWLTPSFRKVPVINNSITQEYDYGKSIEEGNTGKKVQHGLPVKICFVENGIAKVE